MFNYTIRRLLNAVPTLFVVMTMTFFLIRFAPGGPFDSDRAWPPEVQKNIEEKYGLHLPLHEQYLVWLKDVAQGDLRESFQYIGKPVTELLSESIGASALLGFLAVVFSILIGIPLGCISAWKQGTWIDSSAMFVAISGVSLPSYLVASLLILVFSLHLGWFPPALWEGPEAVVLPVLTLAIRPMAMIARLTRASMIDSFSADYIRTAYAKGLTQKAVIFKHALRNSLIPVVTILGPITASLITGSFVVEIVFQIPGLGKHFVGAILNRDYPLVMGVTLLYGVILVLSNLLVDLAYAWIDPRIRLQ